jgi:hypothetical protein
VPKDPEGVGRRRPELTVARRAVPISPKKSSGGLATGTDDQVIQPRSWKVVFAEAWQWYYVVFIAPLSIVARQCGSRGLSRSSVTV